MTRAARVFQRIELIALAIGLSVGALSSVLVTWWGSLPVAFRELFRGGNIGGQFLAVAAIIGLVGLILFVVNLFSGIRGFWFWRLLGYSCFLISLTFFGSLV